MAGQAEGNRQPVEAVMTDCKRESLETSRNIVAVVVDKIVASARYWHPEFRSPPWFPSRSSSSTRVVMKREEEREREG